MIEKDKLGLPWSACGHGNCSCGMIWSKPDDCPVMIAEHGDWGDTYPAIKIENPSAINEPAIPYTEKIVYGHIPPELAKVRIKYAILAANHFKEAVRILQQIISDLPSKRDWLDPTLESHACNLLTRIKEARDG